MAIQDTTTALFRRLEPSLSGSMQLWSREFQAFTPLNSWGFERNLCPHGDVYRWHSSIGGSTAAFAINRSFPANQFGQSVISVPCHASQLELWSTHSPGLVLPFLDSPTEIYPIYEMPSSR